MLTIERPLENKISTRWGGVCVCAVDEVLIRPVPGMVIVVNARSTVESQAGHSLVHVLVCERCEERGGGEWLPGEERGGCEWLL